MKKIALLLCLCFLIGLSGCAETEVPATDVSTKTSTTETASSDKLKTDGSADVSDSGASTDTSGSDVPTDTSSGTDEKPDQPSTAVIYDPTMEHKFIATDIINFSLVVYDLNLCNGDFQKLADDDSAIIWEWKSRSDSNCRLASKIIRSISGVKFRHSGCWDRDVVVACANFGWVGVIDYESCSLIWECELPVGPHSVEMLPNGDVVVGSADGDGALIYIPLSAGATKPVHMTVFPSCHGVCWDPEREFLWALGLNGICAYAVENMGSFKGKLVKIDGMEYPFDGDRGGHAFAPVAGQPGNYWVSAGKLWKFDSHAGKMTGASFSAGSIKGICSYEDNTVIQSIAGLNRNNKYSWGSDGFRIITRVLSDGKVKIPVDKVTTVTFANQRREFYKIQAFTKNYQ